MCCLFPSVIAVGKDRSILLAATVMTQGAVFWTTCGAGPKLPAAYTTVIPFWTACRAPNEFSSTTSDSTSTPSYRVFDGREHGGRAAGSSPAGAAPDGLVHRDAGSGRATARRARGKAVEACRFHDRARRGGRRVRAVAVGIPRREVLVLEFLLGHARMVELRADDLAATVAAVPAHPDLAHAFPP
jgi:hypothetical protein